MLIKTMGSPKQGTLGFGFYRNSVLLSPFNTFLYLLTDSIPGDVDGSDLSCQCSFSCPAKLSDARQVIIATECCAKTQVRTLPIPACPYIYPLGLSLIVRQNKSVEQLVHTYSGLQMSEGGWFKDTQRY